MQRVLSLILILAGVSLSFVDKLYNFELKTREFVCLYLCEGARESRHCRSFFFIFHVSKCTAVEQVFFLAIICYVFCIFIRITFDI